MDCGADWAGIERGLVVSVSGGKAVIRSFGRSGLLTPPLPCLTSGLTLAANDRVYFFLFEDGTGAIMGKSE